METINNRIKIIRKNAKLTQTAFGERIGVTKNAVVNMEIPGRSKISDAYIKAICREFDVREEWLRTGEGEMFVPKRSAYELERFFSEVTFESPGFRRAFLTVLAHMTPQEWDLMEQKGLELMEEMKKSPTDDGQA